MEDSTPHEAEVAQPARWQPLTSVDRRVLGVLIEKAKTTPDQYPLTLSALRAGANQKNNRDPVMQIESETIEESLERLRAMGAVAEVQGAGRVPRYRHHAYEWLGVSKVELAVMAELLLRGAQTVGQLRGRAARMEPIADLPALWPHLHALRVKDLVVFLTLEGRGCVVTHALHPQDEFDRVRSKYTSGTYDCHAEEAMDPTAPANAGPRTVTSFAGAQPAPSGSAAHFSLDELSALRSELDELRAQLDQVAHGWQSESTRIQEEIADLRARLVKEEG